MIKPYLKRSIDYTAFVEVYRCLTRKGKVYSIRQFGVVVGHTKAIILRNTDFIVQKGGQKRARESKSRNVHAFIRGYIDPYGYFELVQQTSENKVIYHPFKTDTFVVNSKPIRTSKITLINEIGVFAQ